MDKSGEQKKKKGTSTTLLEIEISGPSSYVLIYIHLASLHPPVKSLMNI